MNVLGVNKDPKDTRLAQSRLRGTRRGIAPKTKDLEK